MPLHCMRSVKYSKLLLLRNAPILMRMHQLTNLLQQQPHPYSYDACNASAPTVRELIFRLIRHAQTTENISISGTTWNYQISYAPKFMDQVHAHCKKNVENHHVSKKQMEVIVFPTQRRQLATFTPNTLIQIQSEEMCSAAVPSKCIKPAWHKSACSGRVSPSTRPRQSMQGHLWHQEEQEEVVQAVNSKSQQQATSVTEVQ